MVEGGWGVCAWRNPPLLVLDGVEGQRVGVRSARGPSDLTTAGAPRRYPVMEPWGRRGHTPLFGHTRMGGRIGVGIPGHRAPARVDPAPTPRTGAGDGDLRARGAARRAVIDALSAPAGREAART